METFNILEKFEHWNEEQGYKKKKINLEIPLDFEDALLEKIQQLLEKGEDTAYLEEIKDINIEELKKIKKLKEIGVSTDIGKEESCLNVDTIDEINDEIDNLLEEWGIKYVLIGAKENSAQEKLSINEYKKIRSILNEVVADIGKDLSDKEKFKIVYTRLANMITYDFEAIDKDTEYAKNNENNCRNLKNGLLLGKCVCAGYAEILKQTLSLVGIESHCVVSKSDKDKDRHVFNIVKIDGEWYYTDLTWDYEYIRNGLPPKFCLNNEKDFTNLESDEKNLHIMEENCKFDREFNLENAQMSQKSINLYPELKKNIFAKKLKMYADLVIIPKMSDILRKMGDKFFRNNNLLLEPTSNERKIDVNNFNQMIKQGAPTIEEQVEFASKLNKNEKTNTEETRMEKNDKKSDMYRE